MERLKKIWKRQREFNELVNGKVKTIEDKQTLTKEFILHLFSEADEVLREINWKMHRKKDIKVNEQNLKEEVIDLFKYWLGIAQIWNISPEEFIEEFHRKSDVVEQRFKQEKQLHLLKDEKIIGIDIDGVLAEYPESFLSFVKKETKLKIETNSYDLIKILSKKIGREKATALKEKYRKTGQKRYIKPIKGAAEALRYFKKQGYTIVLLSARPVKKYTRIFADTIYWLKKNKMVYDAILWDEDKEDRIIKEIPNMDFMVEDVLSNANKISELGYKVYLINKVYNQGQENRFVKRINNWEEIIMEEKK